LTVKILNRITPLEDWISR